MLNRRAFLGRAAAVIVGLTVASKVPTAWLPSPVQRYAAIEYLRRAYYDAIRGKRLEEFPREIRVASWLYDAYESELVPLQRFSSDSWHPSACEPTLLFKGLLVRKDKQLRGWDYAIV